jgi:hypothetical protein
LALVLLVFASGFLLGRLGSVAPSQPTVSALPVAKPIPIPREVLGSLAYLYSSREQLATIAQHDLFSGQVTPRARLSLPPAIEAGDELTTRVTALGRSVALTLLDNDEGYVAFSPQGRAVHAWVPGVDAAWLSETELVVRGPSGPITQWTSETDSVASRSLGDADELIQTPSGAVVRRGRTIEALSSPRRSFDLPAEGAVIAVAADTTRALISASKPLGDGPMLWDGKRSTVVRSGSGDVLGAAFDHTGERVAVVQATEDGLVVAVSDMRGNAALKPISSEPGCATPSWDEFGKWVYVATADGMLHAVEAAGGRIQSIEIQSVGCGAAWIDTR